MPRSRLELHRIFEDILGTKNVYYQPPPNIFINYPAIIYSRKTIDNQFADNFPYAQTVCYEVTVIDYDPDSDIVMRISSLPLCRFDRHYTSDQLNHDAFTLYF